MSFFAEVLAVLDSRHRLHASTDQAPGNCVPRDCPSCHSQLPPANDRRPANGRLAVYLSTQSSESRTAIHFIHWANKNNSSCALLSLPPPSSRPAPTSLTSLPSVAPFLSTFFPISIERDSSELQSLDLISRVEIHLDISSLFDNNITVQTFCSTLALSLSRTPSAYHTTYDCHYLAFLLASEGESRVRLVWYPSSA